MVEVEEIETVERCEAYWKQLNRAFALLNFKNASLVHNVPLRKMAKW